MKKFTLALSLILFFAAAQLSAQTCNNMLTVTVSGVVNSSTCTTPCNGSATGNASGASTYVWQPSNQTTPTATGLCAGTYTVYAFDATFANCGSKIVTITCPQAVNETEASTYVEVFPNPASENLSIKFTYPNGGVVKEVSVYNSIGEKVMLKLYGTSGKFSNTISVSELPKGIYFLEVRDEKNAYRTRFVKE